MYTISPSQMRSMNCRQRWQWQYPEGYRAKITNHNLEFGTAIHAALEHHYLPSDPTQALEEPKDPMDIYFEKWMDHRIKEIDAKHDEVIQQFTTLKDLGIAMLKGYMEEYEGKDDFEVLATEKLLRRRLPLPDKPSAQSLCNVVVRLDGIVRCTRTGRLFVLEHKTFKRFSPKDVEIDMQYTAEVWVGQAYADEMGLNEKVVGVIYNGLRKQKPGPRVTVPLFERLKVFRNRTEVDAFIAKAYWQYRESRHWQIFAQPSTMECNMCDFREPCTAKLKGEDFQWLLDKNYTKRVMKPKIKNQKYIRCGGKP